jgi:hypothetical protein
MTDAIGTVAYYDQTDNYRVGPTPDTVLDGLSLARRPDADGGAPSSSLCTRHASCQRSLEDMRMSTTNSRGRAPAVCR